MPFVVIGVANRLCCALHRRLRLLDHRWRWPGAGLAWCYLPLAARCASRLSTYWAIASAGWWPSSPATRSLPQASTAKFAIPAYLGLLIGTCGWALAFRSNGAGLLLTALLLPPLIARMNSEEKLLRSQFGAEYDAYLAHTFRLIPHIY